MGKIFLYNIAVSAFMFCCLFVSLGLFLVGRDEGAKIVDVAVPGAKASVSAALAASVTPQAKTFNILIIPGHDVADGGGCYKDTCERDLVAAIAGKIAAIIGRDPRYKITVARDANEWNPVLRDYFQNQKQDIIDWKNDHQEEQKAKMAAGEIKYVPDMAFHSEVAPEMSVKLYGMNKWADENGIDLVLNLHFNDSMRPKSSVPGQFKGFTIFIPESQMKNHVASKTAAGYIFEELKKVQTPELDNPLEDQSLIALGASGTLGAPSMLIEYAYIYEEKLEAGTGREVVLDGFARQTALGIDDYFNGLGKGN